MALEVLEVDVVEDDAIFDLRPEGSSRRAIVAWRESQSLRYADHMMTWSLPDHIWPWSLAQRSTFSKNNTEMKYKLHYSELWWLFLFSTQKTSDYATSAKLKGWNKILK